MPAAAKNEIEDDLSRLEHDIRQMKIEYEQFFGGGKKRPPNIARNTTNGTVSPASRRTFRFQTASGIKTSSGAK